MEALKSAGRAIIKSPGVPRHAWGTAKHEKLPENWTDTKETLMEGMVFNVKYMGMTLVGQPKGEEMAAAAIHRIVSTARASAKKFRKVTLTVSPKGIIITDTETNDLIENVSIYRISYCTADKTQDKVFAYISQSEFSETLECHAFLCQKKKIAQAVTLTVAQAFKVALDFWEIAQEDKSKKARICCSCSDSDVHVESKSHSASETEKSQTLMEPKLQKPFLSSSIFSLSPRSQPTRRRPVKHDSWDMEEDSLNPYSRVRLADSCFRAVSEDAAVSSLEENFMSLSSQERDRLNTHTNTDKKNTIIIYQCKRFVMHCKHIIPNDSNKKTLHI
ncbi:hypothetical protein Q7C36_003161 [Tachysurus vachellii]|uniref:PID domain-containing protein n=1 Tax=Tachysurus vachellii TaxID=175792 RepID=A0AA88NUN1_TACVA|nr:hypothetical protein Q7C36_003161 [Tachysurus vachellii]